jgi:hypothetical protein
MMYDEQIKDVDEWFRKKEEDDFGTYHHTEEKDGEDFYCVSLDDIEDFADYLREEHVDLAYINCKFSYYGLGFTSEDLQDAVYF